MVERGPTAGLPEALALLAADAPELVEFVEAVFVHLTGPAAGVAAEAATIRISAILQPLLDEDSDGAARLLLDDPSVLASFFQNADLLDAAAPASALVSGMVMRVLERAWSVNPR
ncbi:MAG: hypothetical protein WD766_02415 [Gemmatimonadota bacterium]